MSPADHTLEDFLRDSGIHPAASIMSLQNSFVLPGTGLQHPYFAEACGYRIVDIGSGDVAAVDENGNEAGFYSSNSLIVHEGHRGIGLSVGLALWAHEVRAALPPDRKLSDGGRAALTSAWHVSRGQKTNPWWPACERYPG